MSARRLVALGCGVILASFGVPWIVALIRGFDPLGDGSSATNALTLGVAATGALAIIGAVTRARVLVWGLVIAVPGLAILGAWVNLDGSGQWYTPLWRPLVLALVALLPAALLSRSPGPRAAPRPVDAG